MSNKLPDALGTTLKQFAYLPLCLAITACGGGGGDGGNDTPPDTGTPPAPTNSAPVASDDMIDTDNQTTEVVIDVLANDSDSDDDELSIVSVSTSEKGVEPVIEDGKIRYPLNSNVTGTDTFTYTISDGEEEDQATVTINIDYLLTISGMIGETVSGDGSVSLYIDGEKHQAELDGNRYSLQVRNGADDAVVSVVSSHQNTAIEKGIILKSYAGTLGALRTMATSGTVNENIVPALYLSAAGTSASAYMEMVAGGEIVSADVLANSAQTLPQVLVIESAIALKSVLAGDEWGSFTQMDTYALLTDHPTAVNISEKLEKDDAGKYEGFRDDIVSNQKQFKALETEPGQELLFINLGKNITTRPGGFIVQLPEANLNYGYYASSTTTNSQDNSTEVSVDGNAITVNLDGLGAPYTFRDGREDCVSPGVLGYTATPTQTTLTKVLDTPIFTTYQQETEYRCDETLATFTDVPNFVQVNHVNYGDFSAATQNTFAIGTYLEQDPDIFQGPYLWQSVVVTPNANGTITQRFDFMSGDTDDGIMSIDESGRLSLHMNRGDRIEYVALGTKGDALKALGLLKRADGTVASIGGDYLVPVTQGLTLPLPGSLVIKDQQFSVLNDGSKYYPDGFGFEFLVDGTGSQLYRSDGNYESSITRFSWEEKAGYLDMRYFYHRTDNMNPYPSSCADGDPDCVEFRFREFEPLAQIGGDYLVRTYQEWDYSKRDGTGEGEDVWISSYIDLYTLEP